MTRPSAYSDVHYLLSKRSVDDRALHRGVIERMRGELPARPRVLEVGAGAGTMVARAMEWELIEAAEYTLLDVDGESLAAARRWLAEWSQAAGRPCREVGEALELGAVTVRFVQAELGAHLQGGAGATVDLLVANAFLDLVEVPVFLPALLPLVADGGLFWFTINFDGETIMLPEHPHDGPLMAAYHRDMDERVLHGRPSGDSRTGRRLFGHLARAGARLLAAGSSDWVVFPRAEGGYPGDEAYFLHHIVHTIDTSLSARSDVDHAPLRTWVELRHDQIERGELCYVAHQLDFLGRPR
jgi:hypothetical protein